MGSLRKVMNFMVLLNETSKLIILGALSSSNLELVATKISELLSKTTENVKEVGDMDNNPKHERKSSYKVAVNNSFTSMKSPIERRIKSRIQTTSESERGYRSDVETYSADKSSCDSIPGYSSDCERTSNRLNRLIKAVPKKNQLDSTLFQMAYDSAKSDINANKNIKPNQMRDIMENVSNGGNIDPSPTVMHTSDECDSNLDNRRTETQSTNKVIAGNPIDINSNSSIGSLCPSSGSECPVSVYSVHSHSNNASNGSANPSSNTSQSSLSRNDLLNSEPNSQTPALPLKPINNSLKSESGLGTAVSRQKPLTASSQFIFQKFSHSHSQTKPLIGHNSSQVFTPQEINTKNKNGIKFIDDSNDSNGSDVSNSSLNNPNIVSSLSIRNLSNDAHIVSEPSIPQ